MRYVFIVLASLVALAGCASGTAMFHSPDGQHVVFCKRPDLWMIPATRASTEYSNCRENYLKTGYIEGPPPARTYPMPTPSLRPLPPDNLAP